MGPPQYEADVPTLKLQCMVLAGSHGQVTLGAH